MLAKKSETVDLLDLLIEQVVDYAIFALDQDGNIASWNAGAERIKGYAPHEIVGKPYAMFFTEADRRAGKPNDILTKTRTQGRYQEEGWRVRKDGSTFWASVVITALRDEAGELKGFAKITRDLTERRRADEEARRAAEERAARHQAKLDEAEVRRSRDQLDLILRSISEGVTVQAPDGRLVFANDAAAQLCGFASAAAMMAANARSLVEMFEVWREDGTPFPWDELPGRLALQGEASTAIVRFRLNHTGEERWSFVSGAPVVGANGNIEAAVSVFREFTERRRWDRRWTTRSRWRKWRTWPCRTSPTGAASTSWGPMIASNSSPSPTSIRRSESWRKSGDTAGRRGQIRLSRAWSDPVSPR
jgi:PAS domain S-box-containing protein